MRVGLCHNVVVHVEQLLKLLDGEVAVQTAVTPLPLPDRIRMLERHLAGGLWTGGGQMLGVRVCVGVLEVRG